MKKFFLLFTGLALSLIINAQTQGVLQTTFVQGNGQDGAMFVLLNTSQNYISIDGFDIIASDSATEYPIAVFYKMNRYSGYEQDSSSWVLLQNDTVTAMGYNSPTHIDLGSSKIFAPNDSIAFYITTPIAYGVKYTNGDTIYSDGNLSFIPGAGKSAYFGSNTFEPRILNTNIYYHLIGDQQVVSNDTTICEGDSVLLQIYGQEEQGYEWYDASSGGNIVSYSDTFLTPNLNTTTNYYPYSLHNYFYDNVEDNNIDEYTHTSNLSASTDYSISGNYSIKYSNAYTAYYNDYIPLNGENPNYISYNIYPTTSNASHGLFAIQDGLTGNIANQIAWIYIKDPSLIRVVGSVAIEQSITLNQWYKVELKNINYETQTFDIYLNGISLGTNIGFRGYVKNIDKIFLGNYDNAVAYYDDIEIGHIIRSKTDTVTVTTQVCTGITEIGNKYVSYIYPNPVVDKLTIETKTTAKSVSFILSDMTGKIIMKKSNIGNYEQFNLSSLNSGVYFVKIIYDGKVETKKIIKQ